VRSSFAEFDLKKKLPGDTTLSIHSVGIHDPTGRQSPAMFIEAAKQFDVDLAQHRSKHIRDFQLTDRDLVLFFDEKNQLFFEQNLAPAEGVNMTDLVGSLWFGRAYIDDPYGKTTQDANDSYSMINAAVERLYNDISR
jgi:protein-tyrosine-phosphatase